MALKYVDGGISSVIIGDETGGTIVTNRANMRQVAYAFNNWNVNEVEAPETNAALRESLDPPLPEDGLLSVEGSMELPISLESMLPIFRMGTGTETPISTAQPDKVIVAAATTIADARTVLTGLDLSPGTALTIADDLDDVSDEVVLTLTITGSPAITVSATIVITYTIGTATDTLTANYTVANLSTPQTLTLPAGATITEVLPTNWTSGTLAITTTAKQLRSDFWNAPATLAARNPNVGQPSKLHFLLSDANADGTIVVHGLRRTGISTATETLLLQTETLQLDTAGLDVTSTKHFHEILFVDMFTAAGAEFLTGTVTVTAEPDGFETVFILNDDEPVRQTIEAELAEVPHRLYGMLARQVTLNLGAPNSIGIDFVGTRMDEERTIESGHMRRYAGESTRATYPTEFPLVTRRILPSWGGYLVLDNQVLLFDGLTLTFNNGWTFSTGHHAERFQDEVERQERIIGASFNVFAQYGTTSGDIYTRWQEKFRERTGTPVRASAFHFPSSGRQYELRVEMPNMLINAPVALNITDRGRVQRTVEATAFRTSAATASDNAVVSFTGSEQWA